MARSETRDQATQTLEEEPQIQAEPRPPYPRQKLEKPGIEAEMELAPAYVFLASDADSSYITGIVLQVMGGFTTGG